MYDFTTQLKKSHAASDLPFWEEAYKNAFPSFKTMHDLRGITSLDRTGVDRVVTLKTGRAFRIDEKVRFRNKYTGKVYDDIALEFLSVDTRNIPGWVLVDNDIDYIAYAIAPLGICYLLPKQELTATWKIYGEQWKKQYRIIQAANDGYSTHSVCVPANVLQKALNTVVKVPFKKVD